MAVTGGVGAAGHPNATPVALGTPPPRPGPRRVAALELAVGLACGGLLLLVLLRWPAWTLDATTFLLAAVVAGRFPVPLPGRHAVINLTAVVYLAALFVVGADRAALVAVGGSLVSAAWRRKSPGVAVFNAGATSLALWPAGGAAGALAAWPEPVPFVAAALAYWLLNSALVSLRAALAEGQRWPATFRGTWRSHYLQVIAMSALGLLAETLWHHGPGYAALLVVPGAVLYQASLQLFTEQQRQNERLEELVRARTQELVAANRALERSRDETRERNAELLLLVRVAELANRSLDPAEALGEALEAICTGFGARGGLVQLPDRPGAAVTLAHRGLPEPLLERFARGELFARAPLRRRSGGARPAGPDPAAVWLDGGVDPAVRLGVAAFSYGSDGQGVLALLRDDGRSFTPSELRLLQAIGQQLGLAVRNATLYHAEQEKVRRLEELDQARHQFVATISHELRTPLTAIKGYVTLVLAGRVGGLNPRQEEFLRIADRQLDHLTRLINDLLDLSRMRAGQLRLSKEPLALASVAAEVVESYRQLAAERGVTLESAVSLTLPTVWYDRQRLVQVLTNLVGNALKFTPAGGAVRIEAAVRGREVVVAVQDTGIGIPSAAQGRLFEGFYQVEPGRAGGTGLGLYIARQLVTAHGGRIWVESEPGCGATFSFSIPLSAAEVEPAAA